MSNEITPYGPRSVGEGNGRSPAAVQQASPPSYSQPEAVGGIPIKRYLEALARHKWAFAAIVAVCLALGFVATRFIDPEYTAEARIWIETTVPGQQQANVGPIRSSGLLQSHAWVELLRSFEVLDPVVREARIYLQPDDPADSAAFRDFVAADRVDGGKYELIVNGSGTEYVLSDEKGEVERGAVGSPIGQRLYWDWAPGPAVLQPGRRLRFEVSNFRDVARELNDELMPQLDLGGNFLTVRLSGTDPVRITRILEALTDRYVQVAAQLKRARLDTLTTILEEQLAIAQRDLEQAEVAYENFRVQTITQPSERGSPVVAGVQDTRDPALRNFFELRTTLDQLARDQESLRRVLEETQGGRVFVEALEVIPVVQQSSELRAALETVSTKRAELRDMLLRYTPDHPDVRQLQGELDQLEMRTVPALVTALIQDLEARERTTNSLIASVSTELRQIPPRAMEEARLERQVGINANLYTDLKGRFETARLAAVSAVPDVRVLDAPRLPRRPSSDRRPQILAISLLASLGLGFLGVILLDRSDRRLRFPEEVTHTLGLTILGTVPHLHRRRDGNLTEENAEQVIESLRAIRLNLMHAHGGTGPLVLAITSPGMGDGKSFVSSNLALAFAELGHSTLLIDGDVRRGCLHKLVGGNRRPGLTDLLNGVASLDDVIQESRFPGLGMIAYGTRMARGPELLAKPDLEHHLQELKTRYDVILVDCPPVGAAVDPLVIGTATGNVLFVLRNGTTDRDLAEAKLTSFDRLPIRLLGAVLNDVSTKGVYRYYSYIPGYGAADETGDPKAALPVAVHPES